MNTTTWGDAQDQPDAAIWDTPPMRDALAIRDIGAVFRLLRRHGVSQRRIGALTGQAQAEVSTIVRGRQVMAYDVLVRIADGLGIPRERMGLAGATGVESGGSAAGEAGDMPDRRTFIGLLAQAAVGAGISPADLGILTTPSSAIPVRSRIGRTDVDQLREMTFLLWTQEKRLGGGAVRGAAIAQLGHARDMLKATHTDDIARELHGVHSDLLLLAGWTSHDSANLGTANTGAGLRYLGQALVAAREADDDLRSALALERIGRIYLRAGQFDDARQVLSLGVIAADRARSGEAAGCLYSTQARVHAAMGDAARAHDSMERSRLALVTTSDNRIPAPNSFTIESWNGLAGKVDFALSDKNKAYAASAIDALTTFTTFEWVKNKGKAIVFAELATCHLRNGDPTTGIHYGHQAADLAASISSDGLQRRLGTLAHAAKYHPRNADATDLVHRITAGTAS
ncbi:helix-turn-helix transcriptional regulator [Actinokineospora sp. NBRC 105648]|uniref:helix-turn-helix domain-containing protein n=1 Tax=Actinokineospora sp. NBRC 105648 TaxID=3032206 RepID=UPI0024A5723A|nr:helix-turn-helix transcriptional regulator [Actinokineospora sp. NBRC 105648]GLZ39367.1 XRE family transcriptional regulator [Actinokineospora sp. NBRC 105648]